MSWLRLDDGFAEHPKFSGWSTAEKWALLELLLYVARRRTAGHVPEDLALLPRSVTRRLLVKAEQSGFLDRDPANGLVVHDWEHWNPADPTAADRMRRYRERYNERKAERNGVTEDDVTKDVTQASRTRARGSRTRTRTRPLNPAPAPSSTTDRRGAGAGAGDDDDLDLEALRLGK